MSHNNLANYYRVMFSLVQHHNYSITEIENLIPFERDLFVEMLLQHLEEEKERYEKEMK